MIDLHTHTTGSDGSFTPQRLVAEASRLKLERRQRNQELTEELQRAGLEITFDEASARAHRMVGRPHSAAVLLEKGYVGCLQQAFDEYLGESGTCFVPRVEPDFSETVARILQAGGVPVLSHPSRISSDADTFRQQLEKMRGIGLKALELYHSDHSLSETTAWELCARRLSLAVTSGSDFHGEPKPRIELETGIGRNLNIPRTVLDALRMA
jgi:predicted metal-dependent phosphoesterase TrpH